MSLTVNYRTEDETFALTYTYDPVSKTMTITKGTDITQVDNLGELERLTNALYGLDILPPDLCDDFNDEKIPFISTHSTILGEESESVAVIIDLLENLILNCLMVDNEVVRRLKDRVDDCTFDLESLSLILTDLHTIKFPYSGHECAAMNLTKMLK